MPAALQHSSSQWGLFELVLQGPSEGNPFRDVVLRATFESGDTSCEVNGFYDGEGVYRVRFMPEAMGRWTYRTSSNVATLDGQHGSIDVGPPAAGAHGPVRVANRFHFAHADGTPFAPVGTTAYAWTHQGEELERSTLASLAQAPFNKIRMCVFPKHYRYNENEPEFYPYRLLAAGKSAWDGSFMNAEGSGWTFDFDVFEPEFFRHLEQRIAELAAIGVEADLILFHPYDRWGFSRMNPEQDARYLAYIVARLAAHPNVWWSLANEFDFLTHKPADHWDRSLSLIAAADPHQHLRSVHNCFGFYDHTHPLVTHCSIQRPDPARSTQWREQYGKPVCVDECCYEGDIAESWGNISGREMVHRFWDGMANGGYVTHGETIRHAGDVLWWAKGGTLVGEAIPRLHFLKNLLHRFAPNGLDPIRETGAFRIMAAGGMDKVSIQQLIAASADDRDTPPVMSWFAGGHEPHRTYLFYFGVAQPGEFAVATPQDEAYEARLIDSWDMTETVVSPRTKRGDVLTFASKPHQALLFTRT